jgi:hypothetical protein
MASGAGGCPVEERRGGGSLAGGCPVEDPKVSILSFLCQFPHSISQRSNMAEKYNTKTNDLVFGNDIHPEQQIPLSKKRVVSTIPKVSFSPTSLLDDHREK